MKTIALVVTVALAATFAGDLKVGEVVPDVALKTMDGKEIKLADLRGEKGQVVIIYFQSEKCPTALKPDVVKRIAEKYAKEDSKVKFVAIFSFHGDTADGIKAYCEKNEIKYVCVWDDEHKIAEHLGAKKVNTTFVLDKDGKLVYRGGFTTKKDDTVVQAASAAVEGKSAPASDGKFGG